MSKRMILATGLFAACLALGACSSTSKTEAKSDATKTVASKTVNTTCPIGNEPVDPKVTTASYKGQNVGFCCAGCKGKFEAMSDSDKAAKMAAVTK